MFSSTQQILLSILPMVTGFVSMIGSCAILYLIFNERKRRRTTGTNSFCNGSEGSSRNLNARRGTNHKNQFSTFQRIMIGLSISDFFHSASLSASTFVMPKGTVGFWQASGNVTTCSIQGFFIQLGSASLLYSASLAVYFLLSILPNVSPNTIKHIEPLLHGIPILVALSLSVTGIILEMYNPLPWGRTCWVAEFPSGCLDENSQIQCVRGENVYNLKYLFGGGPAILSYIVIIVSMTGIFVSVRNQRRKIDFQYTFSINSSRDDKETSTSTMQTERAKNKVLSKCSKQLLQKVSVQAQLYVIAFFIPHLLIWVGYILESMQHGPNFFVIIFGEILFPLQGFFNFFVFVRPMCVELRSTHTNLSPLHALRIALRLESEPTLSKRKIQNQSQISKSNNIDATTLEGNLSNYTQNVPVIKIPSSSIMSDGSDFVASDALGQVNETNYEYIDFEYEANNMMIEESNTTFKNDMVVGVADGISLDENIDNCDHGQQQLILVPVEEGGRSNLFSSWPAESSETLEIVSVES